MRDPPRTVDPVALVKLPGTEVRSAAPSSTKTRNCQGLVSVSVGAPELVWMRLCCLSTPMNSTFGEGLPARTRLERAKKNRAGASVRVVFMGGLRASQHKADPRGNA